MKRRFLVSLALICTGVLIGQAGGGTNHLTTRAATAFPWISWLQAQPSGVPKIGVSVCQAANPYWIPGRVASQDAAQALGLTVTFEGPATVDTPTQISQFNNMVRSGYKAILVAACGSGWDRVVNAALKKGVLVVMQEADAPTSGREIFFGTDYAGTGKFVGQTIGAHLKKGSVVAITNIAPGAPQVDADVNAAKAALLSAGMKVAGPYPVDATDPAKMRASMDNIYRANPQLAGMAGCCAPDTAAAGALNAQHGNKLFVVGQGELPGTFAEIKNGSIYATYVANPYNQVWTAIMYAYERVALRAPALTDLPGAHYATGAVLVTKDNVIPWIDFESRFK